MRTLSVLNKLFTVAIVFTMINLNVAINLEQARINIASSQVYAQASESSEPSESESRPQSSGSMETEEEVRSKDGTVVLENTQDSDTESMTQKRQEMSGTYKKEDADGFFSSSGIKAINVILLLGAAYILTKIFITFQPSKPYDLWGAAAGAAIYLWGEVSTAMSANKSLDSAKSKLAYEGLGEDGKVDIGQKQMLEEERKVLETAKDAAEKKLSFQRASATMFAVTAAYAGIIYYRQLLKGQTCAASCAMTFPIISSEEVNQTTPGDCRPKFTLTNTNIAALEGAVVSCSAVNYGVSIAACKAYLVSIFANSGLKVPTFVASYKHNKNKIFQKLFFAKLLEKIIPSVHASGASGAIGLVLGAILGFIPALDLFIDTWIFSVGLRAFLWLGLSTLALATSQDTKNQVDALNDNIDKIDNILKKFRSAQSVTKVATRNLDKKMGRLNAYQPIKLGEETPCIGGLRKIRTNNGTKACPSANKYLKEISSGLSNVGFSMPEGFVGTMTDATRGLNGVDTITPRTQNSIDVMGRNANAMNKKAKGVLKKVIDAQKGKAKDQLKKTLADFDKSLGNLASKANKHRGGGLMAALPSISNDINNADKVEEEKLMEGLAAKVKGGNGIEKFKAPKAEKFKFDFGADDAEAYAAQKHSEFDATAQAVANMDETPDGEIIEDKSVDIWKVISVRYKKTAYDRLLKRIE